MGRYSITKRRKDVEREVASRLHVRLGGGDEVYERFNVAPTQDVPAVVQDRHGRRSEILRWGLVPRWARELNTGLTLINARAETLATSRAFGGLVERSSHRCLVLADGFYEWIVSEDPKQLRQPVRFSLQGGGSFFFAGLWTTWRHSVRSCTVVTTTANELAARIHDRMPVILDPEVEARWLDRQLVDPRDLLPLLRPYPADRLEAYPVSPLVSSPANDGPALIEPVPA